MKTYNAKFDIDAPFPTLIINIDGKYLTFYDLDKAHEFLYQYEQLKNNKNSTETVKEVPVNERITSLEDKIFTLSSKPDCCKDSNKPKEVEPIPVNNTIVNYPTKYEYFCPQCEQPVWQKQQYCNCCGSKFKWL